MCSMEAQFFAETSVIMKNLCMTHFVGAAASQLIWLEAGYALQLKEGSVKQPLVLFERFVVQRFCSCMTSKPVSIAYLKAAHSKAWLPDGSKQQGLN